MARRKRKKVKQHKQQLFAAEAVVRGLSHPLRAKALTMLADRIASPKEVAAALDVRVSNVSYHIRVLEELGLVELVGEESVRGALAHFYKATEPRIDAAPEWSSLSQKVRGVFSSSVVDALLSDFARAADAEVLDRRDDRLLSRTPLVLDEEGWKRVLEIQASAQQEIMEEQAAAEGRMNGAGADALEAVLGLWFFEVPRPHEE